MSETLCFLREESWSRLWQIFERLEDRVYTGGSVDFAVKNPILAWSLVRGLLVLGFCNNFY